MRNNATKRKQGSGTEAKDSTYVEAARWGKHRGWRYVLGLVIILFAWLVVGGGASVLVAFALGGQADPSVLSPVEYYLFVMASFLLRLLMRHVRVVSSILSNYRNLQPMPIHPCAFCVTMPQSKRQSKHQE